MAGKKKKKPVANPARGFAIVSRPSKAKEVASEGANEQDLNVIHEAGESILASAKAAAGSGYAATSEAGVKPTNEIEHMTPEELEHHLEQAELQVLVDEHLTRVNNDAHKQVVKLKNERRQLRQQADRSSIHLLTEEDLEHKLHVSSPSDIRVPPKGIKTPVRDFSNTAILITLWTLQEALLELGMPSVDAALEYVLRVWHTDGLLVSSEYILGLTEAFIWYAQEMLPVNLPNYETGVAGSNDALRDEGSDDNTSDRAVVHAESKSHVPAGAPDVISDTQTETETSSELSDLDDEDEDQDDSDRLTGRWVRLQTIIFELEHDDKKRSPKQKKKILRVTDRIKTIERDMLFDGDAAYQLWQPILKDLQIESGQTMKRTRHPQNPEKRRKDTRELERDTSDNDGLLGGIFGDELETEGPALDQGGPAVTIHDFGAWSGVHPRRLLEEAATDILSRNGVRFEHLLTTTYSARLRLDVYWQVPVGMDELSLQSLPEAVSVNYTPHSWCMKMVSMATKSVMQAEALLATLSLFILVSSGMINTKQIQRLPKVWREMLVDLDTKRSELATKANIGKLHRITQLIRTIESVMTVGGTEVKVSQTLASSSKTSQRNTFSKLPTEAAKQIWLQRLQSPAFREMQQTRERLPVHLFKDEILHAFEDNQIVIICADTGAGKSTQIPSYILEHQLSNGHDYNILVTQPRRISAISIARRVSAELGEAKDALGTSRSLIGYAIRMESKVSTQTRVTFATTGVLLRMLQSSANLDHLDCLVLDEVHERTMDLDLLFIALKQLQQRRSSLKIVLMSATVDATKFAAYFDNAPVLDLPGRTFPVEVGFLEDAIEETLDVDGFDSTSNTDKSAMHPEISDSDHSDSESHPMSGLENYSLPTRRILATYDHLRIDYELVVKLAIMVATKPKYVAYSSAILIFLPGIAEIRHLHNMLLSTKIFSSKWRIHMLHSSFSTQELEQAFAIPPRGHRKVVIATNIAETGITIPDITAVIDTCKEKVMRFDERRQLSRLTEGLIARASARQRKGRAARVRDGLCFHLVTKHRYDTKMPEQSTPEMLRLSLQDPILRIKIWDLGPIEKVLAAAIDPPSGKNVRRAMVKLQDVGAIDRVERLTPLGILLAKLPLDVAFGKMAIFAVLFQCLDAIVTTIASFSIKSVFIEHNGLSSRGIFARGDSDYLTSYSAYLGWRRAIQVGTGQQFCHKYHLSQFQLQQLEGEKIQLLQYLVEAGLLVLDANETTALNLARRASFPRFSLPHRYDKLSSDATVCAVIAAALYPKLLRLDGQGYRNVYTNQHLQLAPTSINRMSSKPPTWLCYLEATQAKNGKLNAFHSSRVTHAMMVLLCGEAEFKLYSGVIDVDGGRVRLSFRNWKEILVLQRVRSQIDRIIDLFLSRPAAPLPASDQLWLDLATSTFVGPSSSLGLLP